MQSINKIINESYLSKNLIKIGVVYSDKDLASLNIYENLEKLIEFKKIESNIKEPKKDEKNIFSKIKQAKLNLDKKEIIIQSFKTNKRLIELDNLDIEVDTIIFVSRHSSNSKMPCMTVHSTGNIGKANLGGFDYKISKPDYILHSKLFKSLFNQAQKEGLENEVILEATHHGPYLKIPSTFIEIGSDENRWQNKILGKIIAKSIINSIKEINRNKPKYIAIGIGGTHYPEKFSEIVNETLISIPLIIKKHDLENLKFDQIKELSKYSNNFIIENKGMGKEKTRIISVLEELNLNIIKTKDIRKNKNIYI